MYSSIQLDPIGVIRSCYKEKFGIPRQPGIVRSATATLELIPPYNNAESLRGLEEFSHIWVIFLFHASNRENLKATVRPPRLGGNKRIGVFASRSNFRPNPIGLSVVELQQISESTLHLSGGDFLDHTPVLDIKPYIPYSDSIPSAQGAFASSAPQPSNQIIFTDEARRSVTELENADRPALKQLISDMLGFNPLPAYRKDDPERTFGTRIFDLEVKWKQVEEKTTVVQIEKTD